MRKVALRNLAAHKVRLALTVLSVVLGTAFIAGSFVFTDTLQKTFDSIFDDQARGVDVRVSPAEQFGLGVPVNLMDELAKRPDVKTVAPAMAGPVVLMNTEGKAIQTGGAPSFGQAYLPPEKAVVEPDKFISGGPPTREGEIAINTGGADRGKFKVGDRAKVMVATQKKPLDVTITGIYELPSNTGGFIGVAFSESQARTLFTDGQYVAWVDIAVKDGVSADGVRDELAAALPKYKVQNGDQVREDMKEQLFEALKFLNYFLLAFGAIALIVGTFIIYNTFSMIVAQRLRELALLRAVGASRRQVGTSVVGEAFIIGLLGSAIGLAAGVGLAYGLASLLNAFDLGLPTGNLTVLPRTAIVAILVGLLVTVASAYAPARRAAKIPPVEAMREEFASAGDSLRMRTAAGVLLAVVGVALVVVGAQSTGGNAALTVGVGALALILAVLLAAPALSRPVVAGLGVLTRPFGAIGRMARNNAVRNPRRTAATAFALTLGLMLVTAIGMLGASAKESVGVLVDKGVKADYVLSGPPLIGVPLEAGSEVREKVPGVEEAVGFRIANVKVADDGLQVSVPEAPLSGVMKYDILRGSDALGGNKVLVSEDKADEHGWRVGQEIKLTPLSKNEIPVTVGGIYKKTPLLGPMVVSPELYPQLVAKANQSNFLVLIKAKPGTDMGQLRTDLEATTKQYDIVQVMDREEYKGAQGRQINQTLAILYGLLALAVVIAILGIVNTLALSVVERRREIGMLRAVGMQRPQVRRAIYLESMLIAVFGAIVGAILGLGLGVGFLRTLQDLGLDQIAVPWDQLVIMLIGSAVIGVLAALWPAVRAARTPPLAAIADL